MNKEGRKLQIISSLNKIAWSTVDVETLELIYPLISGWVMNRQDSTLDQLETVHRYATKAGCYDAADIIKKVFLNPRSKENG